MSNLRIPIISRRRSLSLLINEVCFPCPRHFSVILSFLTTKDCGLQSSQNVAAPIKRSFSQLLHPGPETPVKISPTLHMDVLGSTISSGKKNSFLYHLPIWTRHKIRSELEI